MLKGAEMRPNKQCKRQKQQGNTRENAQSSYPPKHTNDKKLNYVK